MRVRLITDSGHGRGSISSKYMASCWRLFRREYLDDFSCPNCAFKRAEILSILETDPDDVEAQINLRQIPSESLLTRSVTPGHHEQSRSGSAWSVQMVQSVLVVFYITGMASLEDG